MSETLVRDDPATRALVEAVIISGPRKGEIVTIDLEQQETLSEEEASALSDALKQLDNALIGLLEETRGLKEDLRMFWAEG